MSYILDALRRADAERQQGQVPGLHAAPAADAAAATRPAWPRVAGLLLLALLLGGAAAALFWRASPAPAVVAAAVPPPAVPLPSNAPVPLPVVVSAAPVQPAASLPVAVPVVAPATKPASAAAAPVAVTRLLSSLSPDERRQLPPLAPGGSVWSDSAASRFVILDGQVLREGDTVAPGLVLERIDRKAAVLRWKDQRLEVPF
jgi:general secretion pathway protein B